MSRLPHGLERHTTHRSGWLRAAVLGANDGIVSTASLMVGIAAAKTSTGVVVATGVAALAAGALSMAVGEYISVSTQRDTERADRAKEEHELEHFPEEELQELTSIYQRRGLNATLAHEVAVALTEADSLGTHLRDELGITDSNQARPLQAAGSAAISFSIGAAIAVIAGLAGQIWVIALVSLIALGLLGAIGARLAGASLVVGAARVVAGSAVALIVTFALGRLLGTTI